MKFHLTLDNDGNEIVREDFYYDQVNNVVLLIHIR